MCMVWDRLNLMLFGLLWGCLDNVIGMIIPRSRELCIKIEKCYDTKESGLFMVTYLNWYVYLSGVWIYTPTKMTCL